MYFNSLFFFPLKIIFLVNAKGSRKTFYITKTFYGDAPYVE